MLKIMKNSPLNHRLHSNYRSSFDQSWKYSNISTNLVIFSMIIALIESVSSLSVPSKSSSSVSYPSMSSLSISSSPSSVPSSNSVSSAAIITYDTNYGSKSNNNEDHIVDIVHKDDTDLKIIDQMDHRPSDVVRKLININRIEHCWTNISKAISLVCSRKSTKKFWKLLKDNYSDILQNRHPERSSTSTNNRERQILVDCCLNPCSFDRIRHALC